MELTLGAALFTMKISALRGDELDHVAADSVLHDLARGGRGAPVGQIEVLGLRSVRGPGREVRPVDAQRVSDPVAEEGRLRRTAGVPARDPDERRDSGQRLHQTTFDVAGKDDVHGDPVVEALDRAKTGRLVNRAIAVVVTTVVARLGRHRVHEVSVVVAVGRIGNVAVRLIASHDRVVFVAEVVLVHVRIPDKLADSAALIGRPVAVVVLIVAGLGRAGVVVVVVVVAVTGVADVAGGLTARAHARTAVPVPVIVAVLVPNARIGGGVFVRFAVAVVVHAVADLDRVGVHVDVAVITVLAGGETVAVEILILHRPVTVVVVGVVAGLGCTRIEIRVHVVAVTGVADVAGGLTARAHARTAVPVPVTVVIRVPDARIGGGLFVRFAVAVVVHAVADLGRGGTHVDVTVIAIPVVLRVAVEVVVRRIGTVVNVTIAIVVLAVNDLHPFGRVVVVVVVAVGCVRDVAGIRFATRCRTVCIPVPVIVRVRVPRARVGGGVFVRLPVAVVVHAVADLACTGVHARTAVVAIRVVRDVPTRLIARIGRGARAPVPVRVGIGIERALHVLIGRSVAVVVHAVAGLGRVGVDLGERVVAVGRVGDVAGRLFA